jgi:muramoyltetrapeptide carboxypeptidase
MKEGRRKFIKLAGAAGLSVPLMAAKQVIPNVFSESIVVIKPPALKAGDTIAITSPAGAVWNDDQVVKFSKIIQKLGFKVILGKTLTQKFGYFAGTDEERANELNLYFKDKGVQGIFCMKGGWGCARLLERLDYTAIKNNPKVLMGFSDITSLLVAITARTGLITFHGPVGNSGWNDFTVGYVKSILMNKEAPVLMPGPAEEDKAVVYQGGKATGILVGGNLSVLSAIIGSSYLPNWKNKILFLEETEEEPYSIDRMLTQLKLARVLNNVSGIVFGKCVKCLAEEPDKSFTFQQVLEQHLKPLGIPAFYGAMIGHIENKLTVPLGIKAEMDATAGTIQLLESSVI